MIIYLIGAVLTSILGLVVVKIKEGFITILDIIVMIMISIFSWIGFVVIVGWQ